MVETFEVNLQVPVPTVALDERLLVKPLEYPGFFRVVARYGYLDLVDHGPQFVALLLNRLQLEQKFAVASLASGSRVKPSQSQVCPLLFFSLASLWTMGLTIIAE